MCELQTFPSPKRRGAVLVCVMVVLLIVGLSSSQTIQTLLIVRRADHQRSGLRQARELAELGRMAVVRAHVPKNGVLELEVDGNEGVIRFEEISATDRLRYRIIAQVAASEVTMIWEGPQ